MHVWTPFCECVCVRMPLCEWSVCVCVRACLCVIWGARGEVFVRESIVGSWIWERRRLDCEIRNSSSGLQRSLSWNNSLSKVTLFLLSAGGLALLHMKEKTADQSSLTSPSLQCPQAEKGILSTHTHTRTYTHNASLCTHANRLKKAL